MAFKLTMPQLGLTMKVGTIVEWYKKDGDPIKSGDAVFAVETDKAVQDYESPSSGTLKLAPDVVGKPLPLGIPVEGMIGYLLEPGEAAPAEGQAAADAPEPVAVAAASASTASAVAAPQKVYKSSPLARKVAQLAGIDLATVVPEDGEKIHRKDVEAAVAARDAAKATVPAAPRPVAPAPAPSAPAVTAPLAGKAVPMSQVRRVIAQRMAEASQTTAAVTVTTEADATVLVEFREQAKASLQAAGLPVPSYTDMIVKLTALALQEHPGVNAALAGDEIIEMQDIHVAVAVDTDYGLLVPVIRDVPHKTLQQIAVEAKTLAEKARERKVGPDELQGGTFTVTNLGNYGVDAFTPIINLPQCAILGVGRIVGKPAEYKGEIALRKMLTLSLTFDHRVVDGGPAARFLNRIRQYVEDPYLWLTR
ncbi:MAG: 2-oxo acid dehydrogenase subunit E2 [Chloroflexi bacterium]|nr:2-oxo acid dehydrogenase subunit E2 [Chloroflexota bacterium]